ncbi:MAG: hypothetical protein N2V77_00520 [Canidatus Methanoxibalbensis ujae]|nr:hypothetical protein [Candidatus Methanoxibalbensis ujae]
MEEGEKEKMEEKEKNGRKGKKMREMEKNGRKRGEKGSMKEVRGIKGGK